MYPFIVLLELIFKLDYRLGLCSVCSLGDTNLLFYVKLGQKNCNNEEMKNCITYIGIVFSEVKILNSSCDTCVYD